MESEGGGGGSEGFAGSFIVDSKQQRGGCCQAQSRASSGAQTPARRMIALTVELARAQLRAE